MSMDVEAATGSVLFSAVSDIAGIARSAGGRAWMVGGAVRDIVLGLPAKDVDVEVFGVPPQTLEREIGAKYAFDACGVSFGVLKIKHLDIDVSLPRRETKRGTGHKGFSVDSDPSLSISEAAERRDFTINALYLDPITGEFADPFGGRDDLSSGMLRHVSAKFSEDPLRVLRGMQFTARFGLSPAPETVELCRTMGMEGLPPERIFEEWRKLLLKGKAISAGLEFLRKTRWLRFFPELERLHGCPQDPSWHPEGDVWRHTCRCLDAFAAERTGNDVEDLIVGLAVLCHDFGKPDTTFFDESAGRLRSPGHDEAGVAPTLSFLRRLTAEERILVEVPPLVKCHMQPFSIWKSKAKDSAVRRLAARVGRIDRLVRVTRADKAGCGRPQPAAGCEDELRWLEETARRLEIADSAPKPILQGRDLIAAGLKPSPRFGEILSRAYDAQLSGVFTDSAGAAEWLRSALR